MAGDFVFAHHSEIYCLSLVNNAEFKFYSVIPAKAGIQRNQAEKK